MEAEVIVFEFFYPKSGILKSMFSYKLLTHEPNQVAFEFGIG